MAKRENTQAGMEITLGKLKEKHLALENTMKTIVTIVLTILVFAAVIGFISFVRDNRQRFRLIEAQDILTRQEIDIELKENIRVWLFATDEGRMIYYDGKLFKATELEWQR